VRHPGGACRRKRGAASDRFRFLPARSADDQRRATVSVIVFSDRNGRDAGYAISATWQSRRDDTPPCVWRYSKRCDRSRRTPATVNRTFGPDEMARLLPKSAGRQFDDFGIVVESVRWVSGLRQERTSKNTVP
jgi:hypothetical protein